MPKDRDMQRDATGNLETVQAFDAADEILVPGEENIVETDEEDINTEYLEAASVCEAIMTVDEENNEEIEDTELMQRLANLRN